MALKEPNQEGWLTPENMKTYIEHLNMVDEYIEMQIDMYIESKHNGD